jgi:hypothetical protein
MSNSKVRGYMSWYQIKGLARRDVHVITKVKVFEKVKFQGQRVKVMVSNERSYQMEYTCEFESPTTHQSKYLTKVNVF